MKSARLAHWLRNDRLAAAVAMALGVTAGAASVFAQGIIAIGPPSFQSNDYPSLESDILARLSEGGQYQPQDLAVLARLTVLESTAMLADVRADMPGNLMGFRLEAQISNLWEASEALYENVSSNSLNMTTLPRVQEQLRDMESAYGQLESTLGESPGLSGRAAAHLRDITRLTAETSSVMRAAEGDLLAAVPRPPERSLDLDSLGRQARLLANDIVGLIANVRNSKHQGTGWDAVSRDLGELFALVQSFEQMLARPSSNKEIESSLEAVRRRMWRIEARIAQLGWPSDLSRAWHGARERLNSIGDDLGLPRVIDLALPVRSNQAASRSAMPRSRTRIYRGPP